MIYQKLLDQIRRDKGFDFSGYREETLKRRISRRIAATGADSYDGYMALLNRSDEEYTRLISNLTIKVSHFFRNPLVFEMINHVVLPELIREKEALGDNTLRVWSAGCAHGEEAYSIAILLKEYLKKETVGEKDIGIFGTDVDGSSLEKARQGVFTELGLKYTKLGIINNYFSKNGTEYHLKEEIKRMVTFSNHNLLSETILAPQESVFTNFDIILCRNVLIYLSKYLQDQIFERIDKVLNRGGYLILGEADYLSETMQSKLSELFKKSKIYRKD